MDLLLTAAQLAPRLGLGIPLPPQVQLRIQDAILDAQGKVMGYLNRPLFPTEHTITGLAPFEAWPLEDHRAWPYGERFGDRYRVAGYTPNVEDPTRFDVTFRVGLDVANDPDLYPILAFIRQDAVANLIGDPLFSAVSRPVTSVSADGQSVSYAQGSSTADSAGGGMTLGSLKKWRRMSIYQPVGVRTTSWPYSSPG
jgi:hypothetical protein